MCVCVCVCGVSQYAARRGVLQSAHVERKQQAVAALEEEGAVMRALRECKAVYDRDLAILDSWRRGALARVAAANAE